MAEHANDSIDEVKAPVDVLTERMIGLTSRAVRFDWRRKRFGVAATGGELLELNNFHSRRIGGSVRRPFNSFMGEVEVVWVETTPSPSSKKLALTPYRQVGRPSRLELDVSASYPLAEGVATSRPGFFPATELVFSARGGIRYLYYPGAVNDLSFRRAATALFAPTLSSSEVQFLEDKRPGGMKVDRARYNVLAGVDANIYFHLGGYVSPRAMIALPVSGTELGFWWELALDIGWMF